MQIARREQRKISLISVIAKKAGGEANTALIKKWRRKSQGNGDPNQYRSEGSDLSQYQDIPETLG